MVSGVKGLFVTFAWISVFSAFSAQGEVLPPIEVMSPVAKILVPGGFDDNDNVEVILSGFYPNSCYKVGHVTQVVDHAQRTISLTATSYFYNHDACAEMRVPFMQHITVGILGAGSYRVVLEDSSLTAGFGVARASVSSPDEYLYAPVTSAFIQGNFQGQADLVLKGRFPHMLVGCMTMKEVRVTYESAIVVVQPISEMKYGDACVNVPYSFDQTIRLERPLDGRSLLHVRVTNGSSKNEPIQNDDVNVTPR